MGENSGGKGSKRKNEDTGAGPETPHKMAPKFTRSARGLFKEYNHIYIEDNKKEYPVLLSGVLDANTGTTPKMDLLKSNSILKHVHGLSYVRQVGFSLLKVFFATKADANKFILDNAFLKIHRWVARIPYDNLESLGVIRAPPELSEEDLLEQLESSVPIIGVKRFLRKTVSGTVPTQTVLITFLGSTQPDHVTFDRMWFEVKTYIKPIRQCYTCYKFGHGKGSCKSKQICSVCAGEHNFKDCTSDVKKCVNCNSAEHAAVSSSCPVKKAKLDEVKDKINGKVTYASVTAKSTFPPLKLPSTDPRRRAMLSDILNSEELLTALTKTVISILRKRDTETTSGASSPINSKLIKEQLILNITS